MKTYLYDGQEYSSLWEIRNKNRNLVFCDSTPVSLLEQIGITVKEAPDPEPDPEEAAKAEMAAKIRQIDMETSQAITYGFDFEVDGTLYHFSYDRDDQQNFADTANACLLSKNGIEGLPQTVTWNAYKTDGSLARLELDADSFLMLYTAGALAHKATCMEAGGLKKAALQSAAVQA